MDVESNVEVESEKQMDVESNVEVKSEKQMDVESNVEVESEKQMGVETNVEVESEKQMGVESSAMNVIDEVMTVVVSDLRREVGGGTGNYSIAPVIGDGEPVKPAVNDTEVETSSDETFNVQQLEDSSVSHEVEASSVVTEDRPNEAPGDTANAMDESGDVDCDGSLKDKVTEEAKEEEEKASDDASRKHLVDVMEEAFAFLAKLDKYDFFGQP
eukprot:gene2113-2777_t